MESVNVKVHLGQSCTTLAVATGGELLQALRDAGIYVPAMCGGRGTCGKCKIQVTQGLLAVTDADAAIFSTKELDEGWRLACKARPQADIEINVPEVDGGFEAVTASTAEMGTAQGQLQVLELELDKERTPIAGRIARAAGDAVFSLQALQQCAALAADGPEIGHVVAAVDAGQVAWVGRRRTDYYGIAIDIGSTTLGFGLVDMASGQTVASASAVNRQREYGADVISRIMNANEGALPAMRDSIRAQVAEGVATLCQKSGATKEQVLRVAIAGNTTMLHLLLGLGCQTLGVVPFTPVTLDAMSFGYGELFDGGLRCPVDILPGFSAYVGADITAGILFTELYKSDKPAFLLDIGTNGEMAVASGGRILCTSTAAGPALEGGKIQWGTGSVPGAIAGVKYNGSGFDITTIGDEAPVGICGSGVITTTWQCLQGGLMNKTGRLGPDYAKEGVPLAKTAAGETIVFTQKDIREVQLGKSAIRSGIDILLGQAQLSYDDIGVMYLAGGFGFHIDVQAGAGIGLFPPQLAGKIKTVGNSSLGGAVRWLVDAASRELLSGIVKNSTEFNLAEDKAFNEMFINNMSF